jgi:PKD repeat protein
MKTKITLINSRSFARGLAVVVSMVVWSIAHGQATFLGGQTYWVNGVGVDVVAPKDTFINLTGAYVQDDPYVTGTGIINALNGQGVEPSTIGQITILLTPGYNGDETNQINIGRVAGGGYPYMSIQRPVVIKPAVGFNDTIKVTSAMAANSSVIRFNGAQFVTIDGEGTVGQRNLMIGMASTATATSLKVIDLIAFANNGCQYLTIKNCRITGNSSAGAAAAINTFACIYSGGSAAPPAAPAKRSQKISILNNIIEAAQNPIYIRGLETPSNNQDLSLIIKDNIIGGTVQPIVGETAPTTYVGGGANSAGITVISQKNVLIEGNTIRNNHLGTGNFRAISLVATTPTVPSVDSNVVINANRIYNLRSAAANSGVYGIRMNLGNHSQSLAIKITNNTIGNIYSSNGGNSIAGFAYTVGILVEDNSSNVGLDIINNSIHLYGDTMNAGTFSSCITTGTSVSGGVVLANNILVNRMGRSLFATGATPAAYAIISNNASNPFTTIRNNVYHVNNLTGSFSFIGYLNGKNRQSIDVWSTAVTDQFSLTRIPPFVGVDNEMLSILDNATTVIGNAGAPMGVTKDINGRARSITTPSVGAYEFVGNTVSANYPLNGGTTYMVNGTSSWPVGVTGVGTFASLADAFTYVNTYGVTGNGNITLLLNTGYTAETALIPHLIDYRGNASNRVLVIKPATGLSFTVSVPSLTIIHNQYAMINMIGAKYVTIDGVQKNLTFAMPASIPASSASLITKVIAISSGDLSATTNITIKNCTITGGSTPTGINTAYGIYHGHYNVASGSQSVLAGDNNNIAITDNMIQAVRTGIYVRGANISNAQNRSWTINRNTIGGYIKRGDGLPLTYIGGAADQAGIYLKGLANSVIDSNTIRNVDSSAALSLGFRGIDVDAGGEANAVDSNLVISKNYIYNLTTASGAYCVGIRVNVGTSGSRRIKIINNAIAKIRGVGGPSVSPTSTPAGISLDATTALSLVGIEVYHNTVNLNGTTLTGANASVALFVGTNIQGGLVVKNNLFNNRLGRAGAASGNAYAIYSGAPLLNSPFALANTGSLVTNSYGADAPNTTGNFIVYQGGATYQYISTWKVALNGDGSSSAFNAVFLNDSTYLPDLAFSGQLADGSLTLPDVPKDIKGVGRPPLTTSVGALQFSRQFLPLTGGQTYLINGVNNYPAATGTAPFSFATIARAIDYLAANGVDSNSLPVQKVKLMIDAGYVGETDQFLPVIKSYPRMNANRIVSLTTNVGRNDTIRTSGVAGVYPANSSVFRFSGAAYFEIDGSSDGSARNITIMLPAASTAATLRLVDLTPGELAVHHVTIKNCNLIGNSSGASTINTFAAIYSGGTTGTPSVPLLSGNDNNRFENNYIGAVKYGIYLQGITLGYNQQDKGNVIKRNIIGGNVTTPNTDYFGGIASAAGIYLNSQSNAVIDSNVIRNNLSTFASNRGIDLASASAAGNFSVDSNVTITRNTIYKISNTTAVGGAYGIAINLSADSMANIIIANNMISAITAPGTTAAAGFNVASPFGIFVDATLASGIKDIGIRMHYNSINLGPGSSLAAASNGVSSCIAFGPNIRGGVALKNNVLQNRLGKVSGTASAFSIFVGHSANIFTASDNNCYFPNSANATNGIAVSSATTAVPVRYNTLPEFATFTMQDTMSINFVTQFTSDTTLTLASIQNVLYSWGAVILGPQFSVDLEGQARNPVQPTIGADEIAFGIYVDSIAPRVFNIIKDPICGTGPFPIVYRVFEKSLPTVVDTLYYSINGGAEQFICATCPNPVPAVSNPSINGFRRTYTIPSQPTNTSIAYRLVVHDDNSSQNFIARSPASGYDYTSSMFDQFPITYGFDLPNVAGWRVESFGPDGEGTPAAGGWKINSFGSPLNPALGPNTGIKAALFESSILPSGTTSRLISPCLDLSTMKVPTLRLWVSQNPEAPNVNDLVNVKVSAGNYWGGTPRAIIVRPNPSLPFPEYKQVDVCLADFPGSGYSIGIEAISRGGLNIVLDSIVIFDDILNENVTPAINTICAYDQLTLSIPNSSPNYAYKLINPLALPAPTDLSAEVIGNGGPLNITGPNPNNLFSGVVDNISVQVAYRNILSGTCKSVMDDTSNITINVFHGGPFLVKGAPFTGVFNAGTPAEPDGAGLTATLNYDFIPPSGLTNAEYGTKWTIVNASVKTESDVPLSGAVFSAPGGGNNAKFAINPSAPDADSVFIIKATIRFLPSNCDSTIIRYLKVVSAPVTLFETVSDSVCQGATFILTNNTTFLPSTGPLTYLWEFGDGTISTTKNASKIYLAAPGIYTVKLTAFNNTGVFSSATKQMTVLGRPLSSFTSGLACGADSIDFTNTTTGGAISYLWTNRLNGQVKGTSSLTNPKFSFQLADTLYNVTLRATNTIGCFKDTTIGVFSFSKPVAAFTVADHCLGNPAVFVNNSTIAPGQAGRVNTFGSDWEFGNGSIGLSNSPVYTYPAAGNFTVKLRVTSNFGCQDSIETSVIVHGKPVAGFTAGVACQDEVVVLNNTTTYTPLNKVVYAWDFGDLTTSSDLNPVKTYGSLGSFTVKLVAHDTVNFCYDTTTAIIEVNEKPEARFDVTDGCVGTPIAFRNGSLPPAGQTIDIQLDIWTGSRNS